MEAEKLRQMLTVVCPKPDGMLPIALVGSQDQLKQLIDPLGFEFLTTN